MKKHLIYSTVLAALVWLCGSSVMAQQGDIPALAYCQAPQGVGVRVTSPTLSAKSGDVVSLEGTVVNTNNFALVDGSVVLTVSREASSGSASVADKGEIVVYQQPVAEHIALTARSEKELALPWSVPAGLMSGTYRIDAQYVSADGTVGTADVSVGGPFGASAKVHIEGQKEGVFFVTVPKTPALDTGASNVSLTVPVFNTSDASVSVPVSIQVYHGSVVLPENLIDQSSITVSVDPHSRANAQYILSDSQYASYLVVFRTSSNGMDSYFEARIHRPVDEAVVRSLGIDPVLDETGMATGVVKIFGCAQNAVVGSSAKKSLEAALFSGAGKVITSVSQPIDSGTFSAFVQTVSAPSGNLTLAASVVGSQNGVGNSVSVSYDCEALGLGCSSAPSQNMNMIYLWAATIGALGVVVFMLKRIFKRKKTMIPPTMGALLILLSLGLGWHHASADGFSSPGLYSWTVPQGVNAVKIQAWGAGGAGGSGVQTARGHISGFGGGAGGYSEKTISVSSGDVLNVEVGRGGSAVANLVSSVSDGNAYYYVGLGSYAKGPTKNTCWVNFTDGSSLSKDNLWSGPPSYYFLGSSNKTVASYGCSQVDDWNQFYICGAPWNPNGYSTCPPPGSSGPVNSYQSGGGGVTQITQNGTVILSASGGGGGMSAPSCADCDPHGLSGSGPAGGAGGYSSSYHNDALAVLTGSVSSVDVKSVFAKIKDALVAPFKPQDVLAYACVGEAVYDPAGFVYGNSLDCPDDYYDSPFWNTNTTPTPDVPAGGGGTATPTTTQTTSTPSFGSSYSGVSGQGGNGSGGSVNTAGGAGGPYTSSGSEPSASAGGTAPYGGSGNGGSGSDTSLGSNGGDGQVVITVAGTEAPTDLCPNIAGEQSSIPSGMQKDATGNCVLIVTDDQAPTGFFESASCSAVSGWSYDPDTPSQSIQVRIYNGPASSGSLLATVTANESRSDVNQVMGVSGDHGYSWTPTGAVKDNTPHQLYVYGINSNSQGESTLLTGSPRSVTCAPDAQDPGTTDTDGNGGGNGGAGQNNIPVSSFTITGDTTAQIQFLAALYGETNTKQIDINAVNFSAPVTVSVQSVLDQNGNGLPEGTLATFSFAGKEYASNPTETMTFDGQYYRNSTGSIGLPIKIKISRKIDHPYVVTFIAQGNGISATHTITLQPNTIDPTFNEI